MFLAARFAGAFFAVVRLLGIGRVLPHVVRRRQRARGRGGYSRCCNCCCNGTQRFTSHNDEFITSDCCGVVVVVAGEVVDVTAGLVALVAGGGVVVGGVVVGGVVVGGVVVGGVVVGGAVTVSDNTDTSGRRPVPPACMA